MTNCPNCGHPFRNGKCEYCGTELPRKIASEIKMTATAITVRCFDQDEDKEGDQE